MAFFTRHLAIIALCAAVRAVAQSESNLYHPDPQHLWNRLHQALFVRTGPDGRSYGLDRVEPLLWSFSKQMLEEKTGREVAKVLEEFSRNSGARLIEDPLKRAILQRDLWLVYGWLERTHGNFADPPLAPEIWQASQKRLTALIAAVIAQVALPAADIARLPDNYREATQPSGSVERKGMRDPPPAGLFDPASPWVCVERTDGPIARQHLRDDGGHSFVNSAFLVFLKLPGGRDATIEYLRQLRGFSQPAFLEEYGRSGRTNFLPNPRLPSFPRRTEVVLMRRALLIDSEGHVTPSPLTETVQWRIYRDVPEMTAEIFQTALGGGSAANQTAQSWQSVREFRLSRRLLFDGIAGGLHSVEPGERDFKTGLGAHPSDAFEGNQADPERFSTTSQLEILANCFGCHSLPGIYSFNSYFDGWRGGPQNRPDKPAVLVEGDPARLLQFTARWHEARPSWQTLQARLNRHRIPEVK